VDRFSNGRSRHIDRTHAKITFGEMRASGVRDVLIYCRDHRCSHYVEVSADRDYLIPTTRV
jgi:hypothetical protein